MQGRLGLIPQEAADEIISHCRLEQIDLVKLRAQTERIGKPILGVVSQLNLLCRSNLQQAIPITFGFKMASLLAAIERHRQRLAQLRPRVLVGEFGGAAGTLAALETGAMDTQAGLCTELGLCQPLIAWHTVRDNIAEVGCVLGLIGGTLGKLSMDVKLMMQTEMGEVQEPYHHGRGSSSTMPQKRNPISSAYIHGAISVLRQHAAALMDAMVADHERSTGPWQIEWIVQIGRAHV